MLKVVTIFSKIFVSCFSLFLSVVLFVSGTTIKSEAAVSRCEKAYRSLRNSNTGRMQSPDVLYSEINKGPKREVEVFLERTLTKREAQALVNAYLAPRFLRKDLAYLKEPMRIWILEKAGFSKKEIDIILFQELLSEPLDALAKPDRNLAQKILAGTVSAKENNWVYGIGLNYSTPRTIGDIGRIIRSIPGDPLKIVLEMPNPKTGKITKVTVNANNVDSTDGRISHIENRQDYHIVAGVPEISQIFTAYQSNRKTLSMRELNLPKSKSPDSELKSIGPEYTRGWSEIQEQIAFGEALRNLKTLPHPHKTHFEYFTLKIPHHINYIRNGITKSRVFNAEDRQTALHRLSQLEQEARQAIRKKAVTYVWWLTFNLNLARVISGEKILKEAENNNTFELIQLHSLVSLFPLILTLPVTEATLGKATLSRAFSNRTLPFGLATEPTKQDNNWTSPIEFAIHDLSHADGSAPLNAAIYSHLSERQPIDTKVHIKFMETLSGQERKMAEDAYFNYIHDER